MKIIEKEDYTELSKEAAKIIISQIKKKPTSVICFATGSTVLGLYKELINKKNKVDFSKIIAFNLDEYLGLSKNNKQSYNYFLKKKLFNHINIKKQNINLLDGSTKNTKKLCIDYEKKLKKHPIDIIILGIGVNGHIGFNEPGSKFNSKTRIINLSKETIKSNSRFFKNIKEFLKKAITLGISTILKSKKIILLASGKNKAEIIKNFLKGPITEKLPATALRKHKNITVIIDKKAASLLN
ncbi:glucosamine-6-phosphate deaminase [Candidatus Woesearchaeota archaeon]|nr:glucosamine-6-phosphate deaminase [Candidatus Woesearchaeota archaeon]